MKISKVTDYAALNSFENIIENGANVLFFIILKIKKKYISKKSEGACVE